MHATNRLQKSLNRKSVRKRVIRYGLVTINVAVLAAVVGFVLASSHGSHSVAANAVNAAKAESNPVDGLTSYDIAANVARMTSLPESTAISNQAQSAKVAQAVSTSDAVVVSKPQIVATALKSRDDIKSYTAAAGDTVTTLAQKFGVTTDSIKWSNNLSTDAVAAGTKLNIPPVNGIVYTVAAGDTAQSLATKFKANTDQIISSNNAEINGIKTGEVVLIPNGQIQAPAAVAVRATATRATNLLGGSGSFTAVYGSNGYDYGYCTYYAAARSGAPSNWGNANTWAYYAALSGWTVSSTPVPGAIAQTGAGYLGHVAIVESVSPDGTQIKYSDMNGIAGWGRVGFSDWTPVSHFQHYIYH